MKILAGLFIAVIAIWLLSLPVLLVFSPSGIETERASTVLVNILSDDPDEHGYGSGVYLGGGLILTARHVVIADDEAGYNLPTDARAKLTVETSTGEVQPAHLVFVSEDQDFAVIAVNRPLAIPASQLTCRAPVLNEAVELTGNPGGFIRYAVSPGTVAGTNPFPPIVQDKAIARGWQNLVFVAGFTFPGMSGGGVFDKNGLLLGITVASLGNVYDGFVPSASICAALPAIDK